MAPDASLVVYHESVVRHNLCDEESTQNSWCQPRSIPRMAPPASQAPAIEPRFPIAVTIRTLPTRFFQNRDTSSRTRKSWASLPVGDATFNCVYPANHPAARVGFSDVIGDAMAPTRIESGCPLAISTPAPASTALRTNHV